MGLLSWLNADKFSVLRDKVNTAITAIGKLYVSNGDTTFGYLADKLLGGSGVTLTKNNAGANETLTINVDVSAKLNISSIIQAYTSSAGPITYLNADTTILNITPSGSKSSAKMKYTFMGFLSNNVADTATIKIKKNGVEIASTKHTTNVGGQLNFCLVWYSLYAANDLIIATIKANGDPGDVSNCILICECSDAV